jgi:hypothetical protein
VTTRQLPTVQCTICGRRLAHEPGKASTVLTKHYEREHEDVLTTATTP